MFLILKFCQLTVIFSLFISNTFASDVERIRNIANSKSFIEENKTATELAQNVIDICEENKNTFKFLYEDDLTLFKKIEKIAQEIYHASEVVADTKVRQQLKDFETKGFGKLPVCIAKTQYSFSTDPNLKGAPTGHVLPIREVRLSSGAEFIVVVCGDIMTMPGLPSVPAANSIKLNDHGEIEGLF